MASITIKLAQSVLGGSGEYTYEISDIKALGMIQELINEKMSGLSAGAAPTKKVGKAAAAPKTPKAAKKAKSGKRAPKGANKAKILEAVKASSEPVKPSSIAKATGINGVTVSQTLKALVKEGIVEKIGKGMYKAK